MPRALLYSSASTATWEKAELPERVRTGLPGFATETAEFEPDGA